MVVPHNTPPEKLFAQCFIAFLLLLCSHEFISGSHKHNTKSGVELGEGDTCVSPKRQLNGMCDAFRDISCMDTLQIQFLQ